MNKKASSLVGIVFIVGIIAFGLGWSMNQDKQIDAPSQCYTHLQPSDYFSHAGSVSITKEDGVYLQNGEIIIKKSSDYFMGYISDTGSMRPTISDTSEFILVKPLKSQIKVGDIIAIKREGKTDLLHRVIEIKDGKYITKGDNNIFADKELWDFENINGKVVAILY